MGLELKDNTLIISTRKEGSIASKAADRSRKMRIENSPLDLPAVFHDQISSGRAVLVLFVELAGVSALCPAPFQWGSADTD